MDEDPKQPEANPRTAETDADPKGGGNDKKRTSDFEMETDWPDKEIDHLIRDDTRIEIGGIVLTKKDLVEGSESVE